MLPTKDETSGTTVRNLNFLFPYIPCKCKHLSFYAESTKSNLQTNKSNLWIVMFEKFEDVFTVPYFVDNPVLKKNLIFNYSGTQDTSLDFSR